MIEIKCRIRTVHNYVGLSVHDPLLCFNLFFEKGLKFIQTKLLEVT